MPSPINGIANDMPEVRVAAETRATLAADLTMRCLLKTKYDRDSRHSKVAIAWAQSRAEKLSRAMLEHIGQQTAGFSIQLNIIELLDRHKALICYDLFLEECEKHVRSEISRSLDRPVYIATRRGKVFYIQRSDRRVEQKVAERYGTIEKADKGPRPFFVDLMNPPIYDEGVRVENSEGDNPEAEDPKADLSVSEEDEDGDDRSEKTGANQNAPKEGTAGEDRVTAQVAVERKVIGPGNIGDGEGNAGEGEGKATEEDNNIREGGGSVV